ncbi:MAG: insulinase family protein [Gammaproteobacteria bacterium]|nr:insulinase family protein [Gammaproteobacteria bacterium]
MKIIPIVLLLALAGCEQTDKTSIPSSDGIVTITKSPNDDRSYRYLTLDNGLRVLLASDPATDKAAASLVAMRGSYHEPEAFAGLAHFLEHMLFIGTEKYPEVDGYQDFVSAHGGSSNAYTAADHTNYFFDIQPGYFREGLDRFAQFFISPLFDSAYVDREKHAVHSEYQLQIKDDGWRAFSVQKSALNPAHPGSRFSIGNLETLGEGVNDALLDFFARNYSANQMVLVALTNESLDEMESWIVPMFAAIQNRKLEHEPQTERLFLESELPAVLRYQTLKEVRQVSYNFPIPSTDSHYKKKPAIYITNLLGHEGIGSLHKHLKDAGWIESLSAGSNRFDENSAVITITIQLTKPGAAQIDTITNLLFSYIDLLKKSEPEAWRYDEQAVVAKLGFRFQEKTSPTGFVYRLGPNFDRYPAGDVLVGPYMMEEFDSKLIKEYLGYLRADNLLMEISGPDVTGDQVEPWFQVPYSLERKPIEIAATEAKSLHLPERNNFLPEDLSLLANDDEGPEKVIDDGGIEFWLDQDTEFGAPRANVYLTLGVEGGLENPVDIVMAQAYRRLVVDSLNEFSYPALLAGVGYQLAVTPAGFRISLGGYNDKQSVLLAEVLQAFVNLEIDPDRYALIKDELIRQWQNFRHQRPYSQTNATLTHLLVSSSWPPAELAAALADLGPKDLQRWRTTRLQKFTTRGLLHGNLGLVHAQEIAKLIRSNLPTGEFPLTRPRVTTITEALRTEVPIEHQDASMILYLQNPSTSVSDRAMGALTVQLIRQAYFTSLRTEQQLGYVVAAANRPLRDLGGIAFIVQSPVASPAALERATRLFLDTQVPALEAMSEETFSEHKAGLVTLLTKRDENLAQRSRRYLADLNLDINSFDSLKQIAVKVNSLTKTQMLTSLEGLIDRFEKQRVVIYSTGKFEETPDTGRKLDNVVAFKRR